MNNIIIAGRIVADATVIKNHDGSATALFRIASRRTYANSTNTVDTDFIPCSMFVPADKVKANKLGVIPYIQKGKAVTATGSIRSYITKDAQGNNNYGTSIQITNIELMNASTAVQRANAKAFAVGNAQAQPVPVAQVQTQPEAPAVQPEIPATPVSLDDVPFDEFGDIF